MDTSESIAPNSTYIPIHAAQNDPNLTALTDALPLPLIDNRGLRGKLADTTVVQHRQQPRIVGTIHHVFDVTIDAEGDQACRQVGHEVGQEALPALTWSRPFATGGAHKPLDGGLGADNPHRLDITGGIHILVPKTLGDGAEQGSNETDKAICIFFSKPGNSDFDF